ncbi:Cyclic pyranopterin monophosphate synthase accessory protein [Novipirellula galeiformis]|uniref:cyclic pyranopterin monophosphate synthase n=1 Tax=Novipirellula galeiformis TaxID=2528004 RepID=A0A5C6CI76_9BACT|nr:cyclic pyranopterin monophosphate synthase MoaC [Novipirellula galeiformis]TWU23041.1 Cyclic pyranopterin monophosphate synthase accessory protein [Novipirellula galeiformis]
MSHFDPSGNAHMVDVSAKPITVREAIATVEIEMAANTAAVIQSSSAAKGDVLAVARLAGIQATKLTSQLIPLCHAIPIESASVDFDWRSASPPSPDQTVLQCRVHVRTSAKTGVEMEAMTAASIAALTVYDMVKSIDRSIVIGPLVLAAKSGGNSGDFRRSDHRG